MRIFFAFFREGEGKPFIYLSKLYARPWLQKSKFFVKKDILKNCRNILSI